MNQEPGLPEPPERMCEAEVSLRLAFWLVTKELASGDVVVALDGAHLKVGEVVTYNVAPLLEANGWRKLDSTEGCKGTYHHSDAVQRLVIKLRSGQGDVVCRLSDGRTLYVEAKKGTLTPSKSSAEYPLIREALGQLLTLPRVSEKDLLAVAVPYSRRFDKLARRWREAPLVKRLGILILTVRRDGDVDGLSGESLKESRKHQEAVAEQKALDRCVRGVLYRVTPRLPAVRMMERPGYYAFARRGKQIVRKWPPGDTTDLAMAELVRKWTSRGCTDELLLRIARKCLDWIPPKGRPVIPSGD